jgi:hypothetical protein
MARCYAEAERAVNQFEEFEVPFTLFYQLPGCGRRRISAR